MLSMKTKNSYSKQNAYLQAKENISPSPLSMTAPGSTDFSKNTNRSTPSPPPISNPHKSPRKRGIFIPHKHNHKKSPHLGGLILIALRNPPMIFEPSVQIVLARKQMRRRTPRPEESSTRYPIWQTHARFELFEFFFGNSHLSTPFLRY